MKLTREEAILWHRKMWNWIADWVEEKREYQDINDLKEEYCSRECYCVRHDCFCCEYASCNCDFCPIEWGNDLKDFMCLDQYNEEDNKGLYSLCCDEKDWEEQAELARKIANLPERQDV